MAKRPDDGETPQLPKALGRLAERLLELEAAQQAGQRELRRLSARVETANAHRHRLLALTGALLRHRHRGLLEEVGAGAFDIAEAAVEAPYEGLLVALATAARQAGVGPGTGPGTRAGDERILVVGAARGAGLPGFAAELLGVAVAPLETADVGPSAAQADALAAVADARELLAQPGLLDALLDRSPLLIALLDPQDPAGHPALREAARALIGRVEAAGFETIHVAGPGGQIAFARRGLVPPGRADGFSAAPA